jgi:quinol-cytochrome oxidoreductase complex cytochrome b subunit
MGFTLVSAKLAGVIVTFGSIFVLFLLPWLDRSKVRSARYRPIHNGFFWLFVADCFFLGWVGANPAEGIFIVIGQICTIWYFAHFLVLVPLVSMFERPRPLPASISEPVLKEKP